MYNLSSICFMCLTENQNFTTLCHNDAEYNTTQQVKYVLPELTISELGIPVHICSGCHSALQSFHEFKTKCLDSYNRLKDYIKTKQGTSHDQQMKCAENNNDRLTEQEKDIEFKEESEDPLRSLEKRADLKNFAQETINIKEEIIDSDDSLEEEDCHPFQFVKCEVDDPQDGGPSNISRNNMHNESEFFGNSETKEFLCSICNEKFPRNVHLKEHMKIAHAELLPEKSKKRYVRERSLFLGWCKQKNYDKITENVLLTYFTEKATTMKSSTLWSAYSMLKTTLVLQDNIDISKYPNLLAFLKHKAVGYKARKSQIFTGEDINKFLREAPDEVYLMMKVILIMGVAGACRRDELMKMSIDDIQDKDTVLIITIPDSKTLAPRSFVITNQTENWLATYRKYFKLRPSNVEHRRFFLHYNNGKCSTQPVGINTFGKVPQKIAAYLKLPNPSQYTGHCFRKTSAKLVARF